MRHKSEIGANYGGPCATPPLGSFHITCFQFKSTHHPKYTRISGEVIKIGQVWKSETRKWRESGKKSGGWSKCCIRLKAGGS